MKSSERILNSMNKLLQLFLLDLIPSANAGVYYYPNNSEKVGIKVICADGLTNHILELKEGRRIQLKEHGKDKYRYPKLEMSLPYGRWANSENILCFYNNLSTKQRKNIINKALKRCGKNKEYCLGMN